MPRRPHTHRRALGLATAAAIALLAAPAAFAQDTGVNWVAATGLWMDALNWDAMIPPESALIANINNGGTATIQPDDFASASEVHLGLSAGQTGNLVMNGGTLLVSDPRLDSNDNAFAVGDLGRGTFTMNGGDLYLGTTRPDNAPDFHVGKSNSENSIMTQNGGNVRMMGTLRIARAQAGPATGTLNLLGGTFNTGLGVVVARGNAGNRAEGTFVIGGTGKFIAGNSVGEGDFAGFMDEGFFSVANSPNTFGHVLVKDNGVVKALRFTGRQGVGDITVEGNGKFFVVNTLGAAGNPSALYGSYLGGGSDSNGDGSNGNTGNYNLILRGSGLLDVDANAFNRDATRPELQGFIFARGNSTSNATIQGSATLLVRQHLAIGGMGRLAGISGFDGTPVAGDNPGGTSVVNMTGGTLSTDHLLVGASGNGTLNVSGGSVETQAYASTYDPTDTVTQFGKSSVNSIRIGMFPGAVGVMNVSGNATVNTGADLGIGQHGDGTLKVTGGAASIQATDVFVQKMPGSTGKVIAQLTGSAHTVIRAREDVTINGGTLEVIPPDIIGGGAHRWTILRADSDDNATGALTGRFTTKTLPPNAGQRRWSLFYTDKEAVVGLTLPGDTDFNGTVNFDDLARLAQAYNNTGQWPNGDFTGEGDVNFDDLALMAQNYNTSLPIASQLAAFGESFAADVDRAFAQVPEPGAVTLLCAAACGIGVRRRRRRA